MNNDPTLTSTLISDLMINHFKDELDSDYYDRLIYTAGSCWIRNMLLDNSLSNILADDKALVNGVSRLHLSERLTKVIFGIISVIPCDYKRNKINDEDYLLLRSKEIANSIIDKMKNCYEISELGERIITTPVQRLRFNTKSLVLGGNAAKRTDTLIFTGIGKWDDANENDRSYIEAWNIPSDHSNYLKMLTDNVSWKTNIMPDNVMIYKYHNNGYGISETFWNGNIKGLSTGLHLGKTGSYENTKLYLINKDDSDIKIALLNEWYYYTKEYMRIVYASANMQGFYPRISVHIEEDHVELTPNCILPYSEERIVQLSSWETINNDGKTIQIIPLEIWNEISQIFINLGISLKEI